VDRTNACAGDRGFKVHSNPKSALFFCAKAPYTRIHDPISPRLFRHENVVSNSKTGRLPLLAANVLEEEFLKDASGTFVLGKTNERA
jgi:hypothetical protein